MRGEIRASIPGDHPPKSFHVLLWTGEIWHSALLWHFGEGLRHPADAPSRCQPHGCGAVRGRKDLSAAYRVSLALAFVLPQQKGTLLFLQVPLKSRWVCGEMPAGLGWKGAVLLFWFFGWSLAVPAANSAQGCTGGWVWLWWSQKCVLYYTMCRFDRWDLDSGAANSIISKIWVETNSLFLHCC